MACQCKTNLYLCNNNWNKGFQSIKRLEFFFFTTS